MMNVKCSPRDKTVTGVDVVFKYPVGTAKVSPVEKDVSTFLHIAVFYISEIISRSLIQ